MRIIKTLVAAILAQVLAPALFIVLLELYKKWTGVSEPWAAILPAVAIAFALESLVLFLVFARQTGPGVLPRWALAVLGSWSAGMAAATLLDRMGPWAPRIAWACSVIALWLLALRLTKEAD